MSVRKRLERTRIEESEVNALIEKGARVKEDHLADSREWMYVNLRISASMLKNVDKCVKDRVGIVRTGWILEAIHEKLAKESSRS